MILHRSFARILFRRRFCGTVEVRSVDSVPFIAEDVPGRSLNTQGVLEAHPHLTEPTFSPESFDLARELSTCETVSEVCALFSENRAKIAPKDNLLLLSRVIQLNAINRNGKGTDSDERIWFVDPSAIHGHSKKVDYFPATGFCLTSLNAYRPLSVKRLDPGVSEIIVDVINRITLLNTDQLLYLNRMCEYLKGYHRKLIMASSQDLVGPVMNQMGSEDLVRTGIVLASRSEDVEFVKLYITELFKKLDLLSVDQKMLLFETMASSKRCSTMFLTYFADYLNASVERAPGSAPDSAPDSGPKEPGPIGQFTHTDCIKFLCVYARNQKCIPRDLFKHLLARALVVDLSHLSLGHVLDLVWISNRFNNADLFLPKAKGYLSERMDEIGADSLAMLIWSYGNSSLDDLEFHASLDRAAVEASRELTPKNIALIAHSFSLKMVPGSESLFLDHIQGEIVRNIAHFNGLDLAMLASAYARALRGSQVLHQCIQEAVVNYVDELPADCISKVLFAYGRIQGRPSLFGAFLFSVLQRVHQFPLHEFVQVMWSYLVMRHYDKSFWSTCLEVVLSGFDHVIRDPRCHLLYPILRILSQLNVVPSDGDVCRLMNHTRKYFWETQVPSRNSAAVAELVAGIVGVEGVSRNVHEESFLVDVAFALKGRQYALLIYNGTNTFNQSPIGDLWLKELFLTNKGYLIVRVLEEVWLDLDQASRVKVIESQFK